MVRLLRVGMAGVAGSLLLGNTLIQWRLERYLWGVPDDYYPEPFRMMFGLPFWLAVAVLGLCLHLARRRRGSGSV